MCSQQLIKFDGATLLAELIGSLFQVLNASSWYILSELNFEWV